MKDDEYWREKLTPEEYHVCREKGTERPFSGEYWDTKFDAGCGWPSFFRPAESGAVEEAADHSHGMTRTEIMCKNCGSHLGHVFTDGPEPTGLRYCVNSLSVKLEKS